MLRSGLYRPPIPAIRPPVPVFSNKMDDFRPESLDDLRQNRWTICSGMSGRHEPEYAAKLGERSYSLYAVHMPIIIWILFLHQTFHCSLNQLELRLICIITVFIITEITYKHLEKPSHNAALRMATDILQNKR